MTRKGILCAFMAAALMAATVGCGSAPKTGAEATTNSPAKTQAALDVNSLEPSPDWVGKLDAAKDADQIFVVAGVGETTAYVSMHEKAADGTWHEILAIPGYIGKYGLNKTKEGDAKTPIGIYHFNYAFGIADDPGCALPYQKVTDNDYWSGDQREDHHYNEMVDIRDIPDLNTEDSEHIVDYTYQYQYCLNISWNEEGEAGKGSAIFLHCLGPYKPYTGGCVAIPQDKMITAMQNVKEDCVVIIDTLQKIAPDFYEDWDITALGDGNDEKVAENASLEDDAYVDADTMNSELYSEEDMSTAVTMAAQKIMDWKCELKSVQYAGDECNSKENIEWVNEISDGKNYTQVMEFLTDFHSPTEDADLEGTAWEKDMDYDDYQFWFACTDGGKWELVSTGY